MKFIPRLPYPGNRLPRLDQTNWAIREFEKNGQSNHSVLGYLGAGVLNHCVTNDVPFTLRFLPGGGFHIKRGVED